MPADSAFLELMPTGAARSRHDDNYVKPFRILDIYSADGTHDIYRVMLCRQNLNHNNTNDSVWMRYEGNITPIATADDVHEDLDSFYMEPLIDNQPWTKTSLYSWKGEKGFDPFWSIVLKLFQEWTPEARNLVRALQVHVSAFHDDDIKSFNHGTAAANWVEYLDQLQVIGVTYWAQLKGAEAKAKNAAIRFGEQVAKDSHLLLVVEGEATTFESDYMYSVKKAMMRMVGRIELIGAVRHYPSPKPYCISNFLQGRLIGGQVNKDGLEVLYDRFNNEIAYRKAIIAHLQGPSQIGEHVPDDRSETVTGESADLEMDE